MRKLLVKTKNVEISLPKIILGSTHFGTAIDEKTSFSLMDIYAEHGGTCIDTASVYGDWDDLGSPVSEQVIGKWLKKSKYCNEMKIMTKGAHHKLKTPHISRVTAACIAEDIEKSLDSLQLDSIDVYFLHRDNVNVPVSEIMPILHKYVAAGNLKAIGASNWSMERILEANTYALQNDLTPFSISEIQWSLAQTNPHDSGTEKLAHMTGEEYDKYLKAGIPVVAWSSQARGIVSRVIKDGWDSVSENIRNKYYNEVTVRRIENARTICRKNGISPTQAALGYITCNSLPAAAIIGPSTVEHLRDSLNSADLNLNAEIVAQLIQ